MARRLLKSCVGVHGESGHEALGRLRNARDVSAACPLPHLAAAPLSDRHRRRHRASVRAEVCVSVTKSQVHHIEFLKRIEDPPTATTARNALSFWLGILETEFAAPQYESSELTHREFSRAVVAVITAKMARAINEKE
jgi:hypothetical protein